MCLNTYFQFLNNIIRISTRFFIHTYFQKIQITILEQHYQMGSYFTNLSPLMLSKHQPKKNIPLKPVKKPK